MPRLFLETTIQIQRLLYGSEERRKIDQILASYEVLTSTYVWMEVQRTIGQQASIPLPLPIGSKKNGAGYSIMSFSAMFSKCWM